MNNKRNVKTIYIPIIYPLLQEIAFLLTDKYVFVTTSAGYNSDTTTQDVSQKNSGAPNRLMDPRWITGWQEPGTRLGDGRPDGKRSHHHQHISRP